VIKDLSQEKHKQFLVKWVHNWFCYSGSVEVKL